MLLSTPEDWFRTHQRDFYEFRPSKGQAALPPDLTTWLATNLPNRKLERLGPSEKSGWIIGGPTMLVMAMDEEEIQRYSEHWEDAAGKSIDLRWQCYQWSYVSWCDAQEKTEAVPVKVLKSKVNF
jgi:hypothetical protein